MVCKNRAVSPLKSPDMHTEMGTFDSSACANPENYVRGGGGVQVQSFDGIVVIVVFFLFLFLFSNFNRQLNKLSGPPLAHQRNAIRMAIR